MEYMITHERYTKLQLVSVNVELDIRAYILYVISDDLYTDKLKKKLVLEGEDYANWGSDDSYIIGKVMASEGIETFSFIEPEIPEEPQEGVPV
jgi:hypothetical protein